MRLVMAISIALLLAAPAPAQQVVDRIAAVIEGEVITLSEIRELGAFQRLANEGDAAAAAVASDAELLSRLIDQWIVATEAIAARFPFPHETDVDREIAQLLSQFASREAYDARLRELRLTPAAVRRIVERRLWIARYLEYKFRPAAQIDPAEVEKYYREELVPQLSTNGNPLPALDKVEDQIRELLVQRDITARAARWLDESRSRVKIQNHLGGKGPLADA